MKIRTRKKCQAMSVMIPFSIYYFGLMLVPMVMLFYYSFTDLSITYGTEQWVGWENYIHIFEWQEYLESLGITFLMGLFLLVIGFIASFGTAVLLKSITKAASLYRTIWYIPTLLSMAVVSQILNILLRQDGALNAIIGFFGAEPIIWHNSTFWMYFWIIFLNTWKGMGGTVLIFLSALQSISPDIYEAANIDGANRRTTFFRITIPLIRPMIGFVLITGGIGAFNIYEPVLLISGGGPDQTTSVILYRIYQEAFFNFKQGFASALSVVVLIIVMAFTVLSMKVTDSSLLTGKEA